MLKTIIRELTKKKQDESKDSIWIGYGGPWNQYEAQLCYDLMKRDTKELERNQNPSKGAGWIHGLLQEERDIRFQFHHADAHTLICGASGSGKTRFLDMVTRQLILADQVVILIDPKGDQEIRQICQETCASMGKPDKFFQLHPAFPRESIRLNPLKNFNRSSELAARVCSLLPTDGDSFYVETAGLIVKMMVDGMHLIHEQVSLARLRFYYQHFGLLFRKATCKWAEYNGVDWRAALYSKLEREDDEDEKALLCVDYYRKKIGKDYPNDCLTSMAEMLVEKRRLFEQATLNLINNLDKVTNESMRELLSPTEDGEGDNDPRLALDMETIIDLNGCLVVGTDSLSDKMVSGAIGKMILSDVASIASNRQNYEDLSKAKRVNLIIDEASECLSASLISLINKGRSGLIRLWIATQTISDFVAELGSEAKADQVIASTANFISFRCKDEPTQARVGLANPPIKVRSIVRSQSFGMNNDDLDALSGSVGERLSEEEVTAFPVELMAKLPDLEYVCTFSGSGLIKGRVPILVRD